jgi:hypothetical protein
VPDAPAAGAGAGTIAPSAAERVCGQAGAVVGASSAASSSSSTSSRLTDTPAMSRAVRKEPAHTRATVLPRLRSCLAAASAMIDSSIGGVAPSPLTSSATGRPVAIPRSSAIAVTSRAATS